MAWKRIQSLMEPSALFCQGNVLLHRGRCPKELAHLIEGSAEARCRGHTSESAHGVVALFDTTMILLESIVERAVGPVQHVTAKRLADRTGVGIMSISRHLRRRLTSYLDGLLEKTLGPFHVSLLGSTGNPPGCHRDRWLERESTMFL